jgi:hypothetical protein
MQSNATYRNLPAGKHKVALEKEGFQTAERSVTLEPGKEATLTVTFKPALPGAPAATGATPPTAAGSAETGTLEIHVTPFATYFVNDEQQGANLVSKTLKLRPGVYTVRAVHPAFDPKEWRNVKVEAGATVRLSHDFLASGSGTLRITSGGIWADVYLDGIRTGKTTPCVLEGVLPGSHSVSLVREGFVLEGGARTIAVRSGQTVQADFKLKPK